MNTPPRLSHEVPEAEWASTPGLASEFILYLPALLDGGRRPHIVYANRVSTPKQVSTGNLDDQMDEGLAWLRNYKYQPPGPLNITEGVANASVYNPQNCLKEPPDFAKKLRARGVDVLIVALSRDRLIRHDGYRFTNDTEPPTITEYKLLIERMDGIPLATILHPDESARGKQTRRGQEAKGNRGGRPRGASPKQPGRLKERRIKLLSRVLELSAAGVPTRDIARQIGVAEATVRRWINDLGPGQQ